MGLIPGWGTNKVPHAMCSEENIFFFNPVKKKQKNKKREGMKFFSEREREVLLENNTAVTANRTKA